MIMEQVLTAVPWPRTDGMGWGVVCPDHHLRGEPAPTDASVQSAEAFARACACSHPAHEGRTLGTLDVPPFTGSLVSVAGTRPVIGRVRLAFFSDHHNAGLMEVGFLNGTTDLIPFERCAPAPWPAEPAYHMIPRYPDAPNAHLT